MNSNSKQISTYILFYLTNILVLTYNIYIVRILFFTDVSVISEKPELWMFSFGFFIFVLLNVFFDQAFNFFMIFEHELCHLVAAILTFKPVIAFNVHAKSGGHVKIRGENAVIAILPYILPLSVVIMFILKSVVISDLVMYFVFIIGFFEAFFLFRIFREVHFQQPDFQYLGSFSSIFTVFNFNLLIHPVIFFLAIYGSRSYQSLFHSVLNLINNDMAYIFST